MQSRAITLLLMLGLTLPLGACELGGREGGEETEENEGGEQEND
jgi:hypothetical protein